LSEHEQRGKRDDDGRKEVKEERRRRRREQGCRRFPFPPFPLFLVKKREKNGKFIIFYYL
jgi:hypothetical protein